MQLLYLFIDATQSEGVQKKVLSKIKALNELGIKTKGIFINENIKAYKFDKDFNTAFFPLTIATVPFFYNRRFIRNYLWYIKYRNYYRGFYKQIEALISKETFDFILFRYPLSNKYLYNFIKKHNNKIIFEHNSKELEELKFDEASSALSKFVYRCELRYAPKVLAKSRALIGVTNEIVNYQKQRTNTLHLPSLTLTNGIEVKNLPIRKIPLLNHTELNLLMICGVAANWHGVDILLRSIQSYKGEIKIHLKLIGNFDGFYLQLVRELGISPNVTFLNHLSGDALDEEFNNAHLAIGSLAMNRIGLTEGATLKVREYLARGIPFVLGYKDTDLQGNERIAKFYHQLDISAIELLDFNEVLAFVKNVYAIKNHNVIMRDFALDNLDFSVKMKSLKEFIASLQ